MFIGKICTRSQNQDLLRIDEKPKLKLKLDGDFLVFLPHDWEVDYYWTFWLLVIKPQRETK